MTTPASHRGPPQTRWLFSSSVALIIAAFWIGAVPAASLSAATAPRKLYRYFAYGSNLVPSTMMALRQLDPIDATAAVLPNYRLVFRGANLPGVESSAAFIEPCHDDATAQCVHGVLYTLSAADFATVGNTEGVPFAYRWQSCDVFPYIGDAAYAGRDAMNGDASACLSAFTLISGRSIPSSPPSSSYLGLLQEGAARWKLDDEFQRYLADVKTARNLIPPQGTSGLLLKSAELRARKSREYYWERMLP
mmetsp:Transcript_4922/g.13004  ORF Transcript_4922/g.13004 Transcript_4922/m.13004 type:complete len:249 (-) Transcript_4922:1290-2036(-)